MSLRIQRKKIDNNDRLKFSSIAAYQANLTLTGGHLAIQVSTGEESIGKQLSLFPAVALLSTKSIYCIFPFLGCVEFFQCFFFLFPRNF